MKSLTFSVEKQSSINFFLIYEVLMHQNSNIKSFFSNKRSEVLDRYGYMLNKYMASFPR